MDICSHTLDEAALRELGARVQRHRLDRNITQAALAAEAGVSKPTLQRFEAGSSVQLTTLVRVLRALGMLERLDQLIPAAVVRPMQLLEQEGRRQRASSTAPQPAQPWEWGE